jgi:predicted CXXCH cytochrome family protein
MNRQTLIVSLLLCTGALFCGTPAGAKMSIVNSKHNLSKSGPGQIKALTETRICIFCHTPHNANPRTPLWNKNLSGQNYTPYSSTTMRAAVNQPTGPSRLCLSCHDGTIALGDVLQPSGGIAMTVSGGMPSSSRSYIGTELEYHHPISFSYYNALSDPGINPTLPADLVFYGSGIMECTTCHDAHDDTNKKFLRVSSVNSGLCVECHTNNGWPLASHDTSQATWNRNGTDPWPRTGASSDFNWTTVQQNGCENCHAPHGAGGPERLLNYQNEEDNCYPCHNGNVAALNIQADFGKQYKHDVAATEIGVTMNHHEPNESPLLLTGHVECVDCHNPHASNAQSASPPAVSGKLALVSGVDINNSPLVPPANYASNEYEICFKCHANPSWQYPAYYTPIARVISSLDMRAAFQPGNPSYHPVAAMGKNPVIPSFPSSYAPSMSPSTIIYCTDCHDSDTSRSIGGSGPRGSHGSIWSPLVRQEYETAVNNAPYQSQYFALCYWCHNETDILSNDVSSFQQTAGLGGHSGHLQSPTANKPVPCSVCHDAHGVQDNGMSGSHTHLINFDTSIVKPTGSNTFPLYTDNGNHTGSCTLECHFADATVKVHVNATYP